MTTGVWLDRAAQPEAPAMASGLGDEGRRRWSMLTAWLASTYGLEGQPVWGGADDGWVLRVRRSGKSLVTLSPCAGDGFSALVVIGPTAWPAVETLDLTEATKAAFRAAKPFPDGRWLWLRVDDDAVVADVEALIALKSPPPRRMRPRA